LAGHLIVVFEIEDGVEDGVAVFDFDDGPAGRELR
jgi:hypothetical protein